MTKNSISVTFVDGDENGKPYHYVLITSNCPAIPDQDGRVKPVLDTLIDTGFNYSHNVLHKEARSATLIRRSNS
jgi:hypothetical protein